MAFFTIFVPEGLSESQYRSALRAGSTFVSSRRRDHRELLSRAGFANVEERDLTPEFLATSRAWYRAREARAPALIAHEGEALFRERQEDNEVHTAAIADGLLCRSLFICS
jgi:hypothetical protein